MILLRRWPSPAWRSPAGRRNCARTSASASWPASSSSKASRDQNGPSGRISVSSTGTCTRFSASAIGRKFAAADHLRADPFRQVRQLLQRLRHRAPQRAQRQPLGQRIDRIDARQFCKAGFVDHAVGMGDLQGAVIHLRGAGDVALGADRQQFLDIARLGAEIGQHHIAGVVAGIDQMRRARIARRRRPMAVDRHLQRHHGSRHRVADFRPRAAIDHARRQMQQQIDQPRRLVAAEQIAEQFVLLRPDAGKAGDRRKQGIEQSRAHRRNLRPFAPSCPALCRASTAFSLVPKTERADPSSHFP